jgi:uncharacterized membrane protein
MYKMKVGVWFYGLGTVLAGILDIAWRAFDANHQPIKALGNIPGQSILACAAGTFLIAAGLGILWHRSAKMGAAASVVAYSFFAALWLVRGYAAVHAVGWHINILFGVLFGLAQELWLVAPAVMVYAAMSSRDAPSQRGTAIAVRWMLGLPPVVFGLGHLVGIHVFASIVPRWIPFGTFWAGFTGIAFLLAGLAICSGIKDVLAARLLALMLLLFEFLVEVPPVFVRLHNQVTWGAAVYNVAAIGACWIFAELLANTADREQLNATERSAISRGDRLAA